MTVELDFDFNDEFKDEKPQSTQSEVLKFANGKMSFFEEQMLTSML